MKELMEFDFNKFVESLKKMNMEHGYKALGNDASDEDVWTVKGYQDCLEDVIEVFKECME
jgi:hypothetical protein